MLQQIPQLNGKVFESRVHQLKPENCPCALVYSESERIDPATRGNRPHIQKRYVETAVYAFASAPSEIENSLDDLCKVIEEKLCADPTLGIKGCDTHLQETKLHIDGSTNMPMGAARLSFLSIVNTQASQPSTTFGGF